MSSLLNPMAKEKQKPINKYIKNRLLVKDFNDYLDIFSGYKCIRIEKKHSIYLNDILYFFDYYFNSVYPEKESIYDVIDYSSPKTHKVIGFSLFDIHLPSFSEPMSTTNLYLDFANLNADSIVIDLGAYSGLTSIIFDMDITKQNPNAQGKVIAVDPDIKNTESIEYNLEQYKKITGREISYLYAACTKEDGPVEFSAEGNMGASITRTVGRNRGLLTMVPGYTLSSIAQLYNLKTIDFIKCDIEGTEAEIFDDYRFFEEFSPRFIVEPHYYRHSTILTTDTVIEKLSYYGYKCKVIPQCGSEFPLIECVK